MYFSAWKLLPTHESVLPLIVVGICSIFTPSVTRQICVSLVAPVILKRIPADNPICVVLLIAVELPCITMLHGIFISI